MTANEAHRRALHRMQLIEQAKGNHAEARALGARIWELAREQADSDRRAGR